MTLSNLAPVQDEERAVSRRWDRAAAIVIVVGIALRLVTFLGRRPLWLDEAQLALNLPTSGFLDLLGPLKNGQIAPIPFLWASRAMIGLAGVNEYALRFVPLLAGLALPVVLWRLARRILGPPEGLFVAILASLSLLLVYYSSEFKQYAVDALISAVLVAESLKFLRREDGRGPWRRIAAVGAAALMCSQPAVFVLTGTAAALMADATTRARPGRMAALFAFWATVFGILYLTSYALVASSEAHKAIWESSYLRLDAANLWTRLEAVGERVFVLPWLTPPAPLPVGGVAFAFLLGLVGLASRKGWPLAALLGVPYAAVGVAAIAGMYPLVQRLLLVLSPLTFLVLSGLLGSARRLVLPGRRMVQVGLCIAPVALNAWPLAVYLFAPAPEWNSRSLIRSIPPGATVYIAARALPQWTFYTTDWRRPDRRRLAWLFQLTNPRSARESARHPAGCEGDSLMRRHDGRLEIVGAPSGIEYRELIGFTRDFPDPRWAEDEVLRIRGAGDSVVWVFLSPYDPPAAAMLRSRLVRSGGQVVEERAQDRWYRANILGPGDRAMAAAYRVAFRDPPRSDSCGSKGR